jgi:hypothetical protein
MARKLKAKLQFALFKVFPLRRRELLKVPER